MRKIAALIPAFALTASPAFAATVENPEFFSLANSNFVVLMAFLLFVAVIVYFRVPALLAGMLDKRAEGIKSELDEARALHEEAKSLLASYERKQKEVQAQADRIVETAKAEAAASAEQAEADLAASIERRLKQAEEQIETAEKKAVKEVQDRAAAVAVAAARDVIAKQMTADQANSLIESSIEDVKVRLN